VQLENTALRLFGGGYPLRFRALCEKGWVMGIIGAL